MTSTEQDSGEPADERPADEQSKIDYDEDDLEGLDEMEDEGIDV